MCTQATQPASDGETCCHPVLIQSKFVTISQAYAVSALLQAAYASVQVSNTLALTCPFTLRTMHLDAKQFYAAPFRCLAGSRLLIKYCVLDCEPINERSGRFQLAEVQVCAAHEQTCCATVVTFFSC